MAICFELSTLQAHPIYSLAANLLLTAHVARLEKASAGILGWTGRILTFIVTC